MRFRTTAVASGLLAPALLLAGCTSGDDMSGMDHGSGTSSSPASSPSTSTSDANAADRMFVTMMIPHHQQAIEMADLILSKDGIDERVTALAQQIDDAQGPEIDTMTGWLEDWGTPYDDSSPDQDMGDTDDGMMSDEDMAALEAATGADAARLFLTGMIAHHQGAVAMAQDEVDNGQSAEVVALAQQVIDGQTAEIATMQEILASL
ncbi:MAG: DUF305 domain-containing protein [Microbacteriaceae bacterium]